MNVAILGYAVDGISAANYWHKKGANISICDQNADLEIPEYATAKLGSEYLINLDQFDLLVRTPGLFPGDILAANPENPNILDKVTTGINEFFAQCPAPIIGVTGTKGKGTTCTLIYKILENAGKKVFLGGNIGNSPLDFISDVTPDSWVILELSNFQLIDFKYAPKIGVCLMLAPEHQDWHETVEQYYDTKKNLFANQNQDGITVYNSLNEISKRVASTSRGHLIPYFVPEENVSPEIKTGSYVEGESIFMQETKICDTKDVTLLGRHNLENVCAAIAAVWQIIDGDIETIVKVLHDFSGMEHRIEFVRELDNIKYYNDSFATTPEATIAAIKAFDQPKVVILGGHDKGIPFFDVVDEVVRSNIRRAIIIGDTGEKFIELLVKRGFDKITLGGNTMTEIVEAAKNAAEPGDVILLSTACASFGLFKNYKDRGNQFKEVVNSL